jgi:membrane-associated PAP2 superfamily phosphatase
MATFENQTANLAEQLQIHPFPLLFNMVVDSSLMEVFCTLWVTNILWRNTGLTFPWQRDFILLDKNGDKLPIISIVTHCWLWILNINWSQLRVTDCEGQSIVEASVVQFSVLQDQQ